MSDILPALGLVETGLQNLPEPCQESFVCFDHCLPRPDYDLDCGLQPTRSLADFPLLYPDYSFASRWGSVLQAGSVSKRHHKPAHFGTAAIFIGQAQKPIPFSVVVPLTSSTEAHRPHRRVAKNVEFHKLTCGCAVTGKPGKRHVQYSR